jgi:hypothetical protein
MTFYLLDPGGQPTRQRHSSGRDAKQDDVLGPSSPLDDLVRDSGQRATDLRLFQDSLADLRGTARDNVPADSAVIGRLCMCHP